MKLFGFLILAASLSSPAIAQDEHFRPGQGSLASLFNPKFDPSQLHPHCNENHAELPSIKGAGFFARSTGSVAGQAAGIAN